jgi:hypothetical protein
MFIIEDGQLRGFPVANDLLELVFKEYDDDKDGSINFWSQVVEFIG